MRGGLMLQFRGKKLLVVAFAIIPQVCEVTCGTLLTRLIFGFPWILAVSNGFLLSALSPGVAVPGIMALIEKKFGTEKRIPQMMLTACVLDNILAVKLFNIVFSVAQNLTRTGDAVQSEVHIVFMNIIKTVCGGILGFAFGMSMRAINHLSMNAKTAVMTFFALATPVICNVSGVKESKYVFIIFYGYGTFRSWKQNKPTQQLAKIWKLVQPCLFGTIGASILFKQTRAETIGLAIVVIVSSISIRVLAAFLVTCCTKLTLKERGFMALAWMPKGTVQAALGAACLSFADTI
jgi:NhaP-type Na+/H+ or K+/H+ antiporter